LKIRKIPKDLPKTVLLKAEKRFMDAKTGHRIAVKRMNYGGKERFIMVAFDISDKNEGHKKFLVHFPCCIINNISFCLPPQMGRKTYFFFNPIFFFPF
jgi:hypothetical protein